jgi:hypothetical protein
MVSATLRNVIASTLAVALAVATAPAFAAPASATLTGTVYADDVTTPLAGATVVVTDVNGVKTASRPTGTDGAFTVAPVTPGRSALALETKEGSFAVATPVTLAPGETRGVHLALKANSDSKEEKNKKKGGGAYWTGGAIGGMTAVLVGFVAAALVNTHELNENPTSPSLPTEK